MGPNLQLVGAFIATSVMCVVLLECVKGVRKSGMMVSSTARKTTHILTGLIFLLCWSFFPYTEYPRASGWVAAGVPGVITAQFLAIGLGWINDPDTLALLSRSGDKSEVLYGPLQYGLIFISTTGLAFRTPAAVAQLVLLCVGDGLADLVGRRWGANAPLPHSPRKSWHGSIAFFLGSYVAGILFLILCSDAGLGYYPLHHVLPWITGAKWAIVVLVATVVESLPIDNIDNITVYLSTVTCIALL